MNLEPFDVWTDHECGCSSSSHNWWIVNLRCFVHKAMIPEGIVDALPPAWARQTYGPVLAV